MFPDNYLNELLDERELVDPSDTSNSFRLLAQEIDRVKSQRDAILSSPSILSAVFKEEFIKLSEKIMLPVKEYPKFNFVGRILGPKGSNLKGIQSTSRCNISILGQGSTRDQKKEEELAASGEPQYEHYKETLHLVIQTEGPKSEAHANIATALEELQKCLSPPDNQFKNPQNNYRADMGRFGASSSGFSGGATNAFGLKRDIAPPSNEYSNRNDFFSDRYSSAY